MYNILVNIDMFSGFNSYFLYILNVLSVITAILVIVTKNPIISVLHLISLFCQIAVYLIFVGLVYLGLSYLLVYVGAVSILFLFILMLISIRVSELVGDTNNSVFLSIIVSLLFIIPVNNILPVHSGENSEFTSSFFKLISHVSSGDWDSSLVDVTDITSIGNIMYSSHFMLLIITSVLLLLGMVGSILITIKQKEV